ncbi:hypothetical protein, partial [Klebsiella pneumoniae]|uniref:hypothetical protein n=1 Tax=Klebsiella pneumoniae TaxID=573 RepID=UPI001A9141A6
MEAFTVRRIIESDLDDFRKLRLEALRLHPEALVHLMKNAARRHYSSLQNNYGPVMCSVVLM